MKKKIIISFILIFFISVFSEIFIFNFNYFCNNSDLEELVSIYDYTMNTSKDKNKIMIPVGKQFVGKIIIDYNAKVDVPVTIKSLEHDYYNSYEVKENADTFNAEINKVVINYNKKVKKIEISYDKELDLKINSVTIDNSLHFNWLRVLFVFVFLSLLSFIIYVSHNKLINKKNIHKYFFWIGLIMGCIIIFLQPAATFYSWDDQIHFKNAYELRGGNLKWSEGEYAMIREDGVKNFSVNNYEEQREQSRYLNGATNVEVEGYGGRFITYNKIAYIPSSIGFYLGKIFKLPFTICFKLGKVFNLITYLFIMAYAIKISSVLKKLLVVIGFVPGNLFLASQYSYDPAVMSGITLGIVILLNWFIDKEFKVNFKNLAIFIIAMLYGSFSKAVYIPFILLFLLLPKDRFKNKKQCYQLKIGIIVLCLLVMMTFVLPTVSNTMEADFRGGATSVSGQLHNIMKYPFGYLMILKDTMIKCFLGHMFGTGLISFCYIGNISNNLYLVYLVFLIFVSVTDTNKNELNLFQRLSFLVVLLGVILLIWTALYLSFTPVGYNIINGVQPRYFLPLLFPLLIVFNTSKIKSNISENVYNFIIFIIPILVFMISIYQLVLVNYCV